METKVHSGSNTKSLLQLKSGWIVTIFLLVIMLIWIIASSQMDATTLKDAFFQNGVSFGFSKEDSASLALEMQQSLNSQGYPVGWGTSALVSLPKDVGIRSKEALVKYAIIAGQLASISKTQGQEGEISAGLARVIHAMGEDPNGIDFIDQLAEQTRRVFNVTGTPPADFLQSTDRTLSYIPIEFVRTMKLRGIVNLMVAEIVSGGERENAFIKEYFQNPQLRERLDRMGFKGIFGGEKGFDADKFRSLANRVLVKTDHREK